MAGKNDINETDLTADAIVHIERGGWDIDPATVIEVQELSPAEVMVITNAGSSFRLTREEAQPFLSKDQ